MLPVLLCTLQCSLLSAQNWTPMATGLLPDSVVIFSISAVGSDVVWAIASGEYYQAPIPVAHRPWVLRSADGGLTWKVADVKEAAGTISFQIVAEDSLTAWITTQDYGGGAGRALFKTVNGGATWTKILTNASCGVALYRYADGQHWLAHNRQSFSASTDNGANWTNGSFSGYNTNEFQILYSSTNLSNTMGDTVWSGTSNGRMIRLTNYGQNVEFFNTPLGSSTTISSVAFQDHLNGLCFSRNISDNNRIARSTNGGASWTVLGQQPGTTTGWNIAAVPGAPGVYLLASNFNYAIGKVALTTNFGESWSVQILNESLNAVQFTSPTSGWVGGGRILHSKTQPALFKYTGSPLVGVDSEPTMLGGFFVSPNPAADRLRFGFDGYAEAKTVRATLTDAQGRQVLVSETVRMGMLDIGHLPAGWYVLTVQTEKGMAAQKVLID